MDQNWFRSALGADGTALPGRKSRPKNSGVQLPFSLSGFFLFSSPFCMFLKDMLAHGPPNEATQSNTNRFRGVEILFFLFIWFAFLVGLSVTAQDRPETSPRPPKTPQGHPKRPARPPQDTPRGPQEAPRGRKTPRKPFQDPPRTPQEAPKRQQERPERQQQHHENRTK